MTKYFTILFLFVAIASACNKISKNEEAAAQITGEWNAISLKVAGEETVIPSITKVVTTFSDFEEAKGRYNLKIYVNNIVLAETVGSAEIKSEGTQLVLIEDDTNNTETSTIETLTDDLLKINGTNENGESIVFIGERN